MVEGPRGRSRTALAGADRRALLERLAVDEGRHWARGVRRGLVSEGRRVAGGWPGTLSEARSRVVTGCGRAMRESGQLEPSSAELDWMARRLNAAARHDWLAKAEREEAQDL